MAQETQTGALYQPTGVRWGGRWEGSSKGRGICIFNTYLYMLLYFKSALKLVQYMQDKKFLISFQKITFV